MIHLYRFQELNIVLDVNSGAVHEADKLIYLLLDRVDEDCGALSEEDYRALAGFSREEIDEAFGELKELKQSGLLFSADDYGEYAEKTMLSPVKAMCLNVSHDCNLRCEYCFAGTGDYEQGRQVMSAETGKKAIDFLLLHSRGRRELEVDFFGGEPLMNFEVVKEVVRYARSKEREHGKRFRFTITTNGVLLDDEKIDYINREMSNVVLSLDGRREVNDRVRAGVNGKGSFDTVLPRFQRLVSKRGDGEYYVRGTYTRYNTDFTKDVLALGDAGFRHVSVEPVVAEPEKAYAITEENLPEIFAEYERLADALEQAGKEGKKLNFFHFMLDLNQGPCAIKRLRGCGCGNEYVAVTPDGGVYPCHQFVGFGDWLMGSVHDGSFDLKMKETFSKTTVYQKESCRECWAKFYCSGGCNANNMRFSGDVLKPVKLSCELLKKRLECALVLKANEMIQGV